MPNAAVRGAASPLTSALGLPEPALTAGLPDAGGPTSGSDDRLSGSCTVGAAAEKSGRKAAGTAPPFVLAYTNNRGMMSLPLELNNSSMHALYYSSKSCNLQGQLARLSQRVALGGEYKSPDQQS